MRSVGVLYLGQLADGSPCVDSLRALTDDVTHPASGSPKTALVGRRRRAVRTFRRLPPRHCPRRRVLLAVGRQFSLGRGAFKVGTPSRGFRHKTHEEVARPGESISLPLRVRFRHRRSLRTRCFCRRREFFPAPRVRMRWAMVPAFVSLGEASFGREDPLDGRRPSEKHSPVAAIKFSL